MCHLPQFHMPIVLLDHGNTGAQVFGERVNGHPVVSECHGGIVVPEAVHGSLLAVSGVVQQVQSLQQPCKHLAERRGHVPIVDTKQIAIISAHEVFICLTFQA